MPIRQKNRDKRCTIPISYLNRESVDINSSITTWLILTLNVAQIDMGTGHECKDKLGAIF